MQIDFRIGLENRLTSYGSIATKSSVRTAHWNLNFARPAIASVVTTDTNADEGSRDFRETKSEEIMSPAKTMPTHEVGSKTVIIWSPDLVDETGSAPVTTRLSRKPTKHLALSLFYGYPILSAEKFDPLANSYQACLKQ